MADKTASLRISTSLNSAFTGESPGDVLLRASDTSQRILIGSRPQFPAAMTLGCNSAVVGGNMTSCNVRTNIVKASHVTLTMSAASALDAVDPHQMLGVPEAYYAFCNLGPISSNQAFRLGVVTRDQALLPSVHHPDPVTFLRGAGFRGGVPTRFADSLLVAGQLAGADVACAGGVSVTGGDGTDVAGPLDVQGSTTFLNALNVASDVRCTGPTTTLSNATTVHGLASFSGGASMTGDLEVTGNVGCVTVNRTDHNVVVFDTNQLIQSNVLVRGILTASNLATFGSTLDVVMGRTTLTQSAPLVVCGGLTASNVATIHTSDALHVQGSSAFDAAVDVFGTLTASNDVTLSGALGVHRGAATFSNGLAVSGTATLSDLDFTGNLLRGGALYLTDTVPAPVSYSNCGTLAGGALTLQQRSSVARLSAESSAALSLALPESMTTGASGTVVLLEGHLSGRALSFDPRICFPSYENGLQVPGFGNSSFAASTLVSATTPAPGAGGVAVHAITYSVLGPSHGVGRFERHFKVLPPTFSLASVPAVVASSAAGPYALSSVTQQLVASAFHGPLTYALTSASPALPAGASLDASDGVVTFSKNVAYAGTLVVGITGPGNALTDTPASTLTIPVTVDGWTNPVLSMAVSQGTYSSTLLGYTGAAAYTVTPTQTAPDTGLVYYTVTPASVQAYMTDTATGVITLPQGTLLSSTSATLTVHGQTAADVASETFTLASVLWNTPSVASVADISADTRYAASVTTLSQTAAYTGTVTWSVTPAGLSSYLDATTGVLTIPAGTNVATTTATVTATGPDGNTGSRSFSLTTTAYFQPELTAIASPQVGSTSAGTYVITPVQTAADTGSLSWSVTPVELAPYLAVATGVLTIPLHTAVNVASATITVTGPTGLTASRSFALTITPWADPTFTTDYLTENLSTITSSYTLAGPTVAQPADETGSLVWSVSPAGLGTYLNTTTGALTFPVNTYLATTSVTLTATGPSGETESDTFSMTIVPWNTPVVAPISSATVYTSLGDVTFATATQTAANTGTITWSLAAGAPAGVSINASSGVVTVAQNTTLAAATVTVRATGPAPASFFGSASFQVTAELRDPTPIFSGIPSSLLANTATAAATFAMAGYQTVTWTGTLAWSLSGAPAEVTIDSASGLLSVAAYTLLASSTFTLRATGPTGLFGTASVTLSTFYGEVPYPQADLAAATTTLAAATYGTATYGGGDYLASASTGTAQVGFTKAGVAEYPPAAMTATSTTFSATSYGTGTYVASASSTWPMDGYASYKLFNKVTNDIGWATSSGSYVTSTGAYVSGFTTTAGGSSVAGEWVQLQLPTAFVLSSIKLSIGADPTRAPRNVTILGSSDGTTWTAVGAPISGLVFSDILMENTVAVDGGNSAFSYYRLVITAIQPNNSQGFASFGELRLYTSPDWTTAGGTYSGGTYSGALSTTDYAGAVYAGEWLQLQCPSALSLSSYSFTSFTPSRAPRDWTLLASNDGAAWVKVDSRAGVTGFAAATPSSFTIATPPGVAFRYFRLAVATTQGTGDAYLGVRNLSFSGHPQTAVEAYKWVQTAPLPVYVLGVYSMAPWNLSTFPSLGAQWIWSTAGAASSADTAPFYIYAAVHNATAAAMPVNVFALCDNSVSLFLNGTSLGDGTATGNTVVAVPATLPASSTSVLAFYVGNLTVGAAGLLACVKRVSDGAVLASSGPGWFRPAWSPRTASGLANWMEADSGVTLVSGAVSSWPDLSGNSRAATQATAANRPLLAAAATNGRPQVAYNGVAGRLLTCTGPGNATTSCTIAAVLNMRGLSNDNNWLTTPGWVTGSVHLAGAGGVMRVAVNPAVTLSGFSYTADVPFIAVVNITITGGSATYTQFYNGVAYTGGSATTSTLQLATLEVGGWSGNTASVLDTGISALAVYNTALSTAEQQRLEGHMAWKWWGSGAVLPAGHPYKNAPPALAAPDVAAVATQSGDSTSAAFTVTPTLSNAASTGALTWTLAPVALASYVNASTGVITVPVGTAVAAATTATLTATGPSGLRASRSFSLTVVTSPLRTYNTAGSYTWVAPTGANRADVLIVAGGAGGSGPGNRTGGGGGGGGVRYQAAMTITAGTSYSVVVGAGGTGGIGSDLGIKGANGGNSQFTASYVAVGGGGGGTWNTVTTEGSGKSGGSGGGIWHGSGAPGAGTAGQGYAGGAVSGGFVDNGSVTLFGGTGGGGAGAVGGNPSSAGGGAGGTGIANSITGTAVYYGAGGGGSFQSLAGQNRPGGAGGTGGGGVGARSANDTVSIQGGDATGYGGGGGGGGGGGTAGVRGGNGFGGIVVIKYYTV
jgi:hypothetical protein